MAYSRVLLLLIGVISSHLSGVHNRPVDFWCNPEARKGMVKTLEGLKKPMLPCVWVQPAEWANKPFQQKRAEILNALQMFQGGVQGATNQTTLQCQALLLGRLGHHITNHILIIDNLQLQSEEQTYVHPTAQPCSTEIRLEIVLKQYGLLLKGKLERFAVDLNDSLC